MRDFDYRKTFELCKKYAQLGGRQQKIIEFLFERDYFEGNYSDLAKALGYTCMYKNTKGVYVDANASNIRKDTRKLADLGLVNIVFDDRTEYDDDGNVITKNNRPKAFFLVDGWLDTLVKGGN